MKTFKEIALEENTKLNKIKSMVEPIVQGLKLDKKFNVEYSINGASISKNGKFVTLIKATDNNKSAENKLKYGLSQKKTKTTKVPDQNIDWSKQKSSDGYWTGD